MRPFLSKKAGASFYNKCSYTTVYHATDIETVIRLTDQHRKTIGYTHIFMTFSGVDEIVLFANWHDFLKHLDSIKDMDHFTSIMKRPCPIFHELLTDNRDTFCQLTLPSYDNMQVIGKVIHVTPDANYTPMALPFRKDITEEIFSLSNELLKLYSEIEKKCPLKLWKERLQELWD